MYRIPPALDPLLLLPGAAFEAVVRARSRFYSSGILRQYRLARPVISIGNITLGGSGKTPLVIYAAQVLCKLGFTPAILTRGYGRDHPEKLLIIPPGQDLQSAASVLGDEPALVRRRIPPVWLGVSKDRFAAGQAIASQARDVVFLLDDGFQHRRIFRDLDIVIVDRSQPLAENHVFPRGTLREPVSQLRRCHMLVLHSAAAEAGESSTESLIGSIHGASRVFQCNQKIASLVPFSQWAQGEESTGNPSLQSAFLVAGIGNPGRFRRDIERLGIDVRGVRLFADHHRISLKEWLVCCREAQVGAADAIITTEKDAIKLERPPDFPLRVAVQATQMADAEDFERMLKHCAQERP